MSDYDKEFFGQNTFLQETKKLRKELEKYKQAYEKAREALRFYGSEESWCKQTQCTFGLIKSEDQWNGAFKVGGKTARQALKDCEAILGGKE